VIIDWILQSKILNDKIQIYEKARINISKTAKISDI